MSLEMGVKALAEAVGDDVKSLNLKIGDLSQLPAPADSLVDVISMIANDFNAALVDVIEIIPPIDDDAGLGDTNVTWSADKSSREIGELSALIGDVESVLVAINGEP